MVLDKQLLALGSVAFLKCDSLDPAPRGLFSKSIFLSLQTEDFVARGRRLGELSRVDGVRNDGKGGEESFAE